MTVRPELSFPAKALRRNLISLQPIENFVPVTCDTKRPIKCLIIGVHGYFPNKAVDIILGERTGTSQRFVSQAESAVQLYFKELGVAVDTTTLALEKEGTVAKRVEFFVDVLGEYRETLAEADFIYFVSHSQGVPVTVNLIGHLLIKGILQLDIDRVSHMSDKPIYTQEKIVSVLGMAGVNYGPLYGADKNIWLRLFSVVERKSLMELFEFQNPATKLSMDYMEKVQYILDAGVKITFVGSVNDQVVPLYSSLASFLQHPNIQRGIFYTSQCDVPPFIMGCILDSITLLNSGKKDQGFIKEISPYLHGPLTGNGHSDLYFQSEVYTYGIKHALNSQSIKHCPSPIIRSDIVSLKVNPYNLPWTMRGLLNEIEKELGKEEVKKLYKLYDEWAPNTPLHQSLRIKLSGVTSKF